MNASSAGSLVCEGHACQKWDLTVEECQTLQFVVN